MIGRDRKLLQINRHKLRLSVKHFMQTTMDHIRYPLKPDLVISVVPPTCQSIHLDLSQTCRLRLRNDTLHIFLNACEKNTLAPGIPILNVAFRGMPRCEWEGDIP